MANDKTAKIINIGCQLIDTAFIPSIKRRKVIANAAIFGAAPMVKVTAVGAPWYTSGTHIWNGTAPNLKAIPQTTNTAPNMSAIWLYAPLDRTEATPAKLMCPVAPYTIEIP